MGFRGVIVPSITPFTEDGSIDRPALRRHLEALVQGGVHGVIPAGSTGEAISLDADEYRMLIAETIDAIGGRVPVIAGCSANATRDVVARCEYAERMGADGFMIVHPYYSLPDERELYEHYRTVSASVGRPVIIYNNPATTGVDASPELLGRLSSLPHLEYVKDSSGDASRVMRILRASAGRMGVFSGTDTLALEHFTAGAIGWVAGVANVIPGECVALYSLAVEQQRLADAYALYQELYDFLELAEITGKFVAVNKAGAAFVGRPAGRPRPPLLPLEPDLLERTRRAVVRASGARHDGVPTVPSIVRA